MHHKYQRSFVGYVCNFVVLFSEV